MLTPTALRATILGMPEIATTPSLWSDFAEQDDSRADALRDLRRFIRDSGNEGGIISQANASRILGISTQGITSAMAQGRLERFDYSSMGMIGVSVNQVKAYARERKQGPLGAGNLKGVAGK